VFHALKDQNCFSSLGPARRIWAIPAIHGDVNALTQLHDVIHGLVKPGDRIVYMGNYTGYGDHAVQTIDEILAFRRLLLAMPGMMADDFIYLRGVQEEMWDKLLQLQFAPNPGDVLLWMLGNGLSPSLYSYGLSPHDGIEASSRGIMDITKWTASVRAAIRRRPGHETLQSHLRRAAYTPTEESYPMLFVHAGLDSSKPLGDQGDNFWWGSEKFRAITQAYKPFEKVIRGFDPTHKGLHLNCITATLDDGCGFGGKLVCAGFARSGEIEELVEV
jgi:serine/threonine protein phosphatase 1